MTPKTAAIKPKRYPVVNREMQRTARVNTGKAKPVLLLAVCRKPHSAIAQERIPVETRQSRREKLNRREKGTLENIKRALPSSISISNVIINIIIMGIPGLVKYRKKYWRKLNNI